MGMEKSDNQKGILQSLDWWTIGIYLALLAFGWVSVCGASYTYGDTEIFSLSTRSGMQIVWIGTSICLGFVILMLDDRYFDTFAYVIFGLLVLLLFATIFNPHEIKGSRSWLVLGSLRLQPAEFAKFATALAISKLMSTYGFDIHNLKHFAAACGIILVPMICIVGQRETGSALVYLSFFLMLYREGMPGGFLFTGVAMIIYFVIGIKFEQSMLFDTPTSVGKFSVLLLVQLFSSGMVYAYNGDRPHALRLLGLCLGVTVLAFLFSEFVIPLRHCLGTTHPLRTAHRLLDLQRPAHAVYHLPLRCAVCLGIHRLLLLRRLRAQRRDAAPPTRAHQRTARTG